MNKPWSRYSRRAKKLGRGFCCVGVAFYSSTSTWSAVCVHVPASKPACPSLTSQMSVSWIKHLLIIVAIQLGQLNSRLQAVSDLDSMNQYHFPPSHKSHHLTSYHTSTPRPCPALGALLSGNRKRNKRRRFIIFPVFDPGLLSMPSFPPV